ncbi:MAG: hypothetical protein HC913_00120 [Microscillaceae bacterium]|nr:hypothetical protein [Microscillaceae bacterium]
MKWHNWQKRHLWRNGPPDGRARKATVRAMSEVLLCRISKEAIRPILLNRQAILKEMSEKMAENQMENEKILADADTKNQQKEGVANRLLNLMRNFLYEDAPETTKKV